MSVVTQWRTLTSVQRNAFLAAFLGWSLDAFDFSALVFVMPDIAREFHVKKSDVAFAVTLTLAFRPVGAFLFGVAADRYGRRLPLMINIVCYSIISLLCGFASSLKMLFALRAIFGVAMGGEWGLGASLAMESVPEETRGLLSGILQEGYPAGYLLAALAYGVVYPRFGWRAMFFVGALPALLSLFIRAKVQESPVWERERSRSQSAPNAPSVIRLIAQHGKLFAYLVLLMTTLNLMSHGTQDNYPVFLQTQHKFTPHTVSAIVVLANIGALLGGACFGSLSQRIGRRKAMILAVLLALPIIPLWAFSQTAGALAAGAFLMQFTVQGSWGVIPAHLAELSPNALRGTFPGFAYQLGNLCAAWINPFQARLAERPHNDYAHALADVTVVVLLSVLIITALGREAKGARFAD